MYHSVTILGKNSWSDYHMVPIEGPYIPTPPEQKRTTIDLKTGNGVMDISTLLTGYPIFQNRSGSMTFYVLDEYDLAEYTSSTIVPKTPYEVLSEIMNDIHGQEGTMYFEDDPLWEYRGTFSVPNPIEYDIRRKVTINYDVYPYKIKRAAETITLSGNGDTWAHTNDLFEDTLGYMPLNPTITVRLESGATWPSGQYALAAITKYPYNGVSNAIQKKIYEPGTYQWADLMAVRKGRFYFKAPAGIIADWSFKQGRL